MPILDKNFDERRKEIRRILHAAVIRDQDDLQRRLARKGFRVTQSSVSRDLQELNVAKVEGRYVLLENAASGESASPVSVSSPGAVPTDAAWIRSITPAGSNLLVIHVPTARAATLAVAIDQFKWPEVIGSIAGDDTIFLATRSRSDLLRVKQRLETARDEQLLKEKLS